MVDGGMTRVPLSAFELLVVLLINRGHFLRSGELVERTWPDPDFEPETADKYISKLVWSLRQHGIPVESLHGWGYRIPTPMNGLNWVA